MPISECAVVFKPAMAAPLLGLTIYLALESQTESTTQRATWQVVIQHTIQFI